MINEIAAAKLQARRRAIVVPKIYGDIMLNDDRLHVSLAISKYAYFSAQMLNLFLLSFSPSLLRPARQHARSKASFVLCIFQREPIFSCAMVRGVCQVWARLALWCPQARLRRPRSQVRPSSRRRQSRCSEYVVLWEPSS